MDILEVLEHVRELLQQKGRITYRILKRQFALDDEALDDLKDELLFSHPEISEVDGRGLVWNGEAKSVSAPPSAPAQAQPPASYTPQHLAERIRAEQAAMESRGAANGERKTITALFADLKGSTANLAMKQGMPTPNIAILAILLVIGIFVAAPGFSWAEDRPCSAFRRPLLKQLGGPPEEFSSMTPTDPARLGDRSDISLWNSPYRLYTHLTTMEFVVGNDIGVVTYGYDVTQEVDGESHEPAPEAPLPAALLTQAEMQVTLPDGSSVSVPMFDDGHHADGLAGDGVFGGRIHHAQLPTQIGQFYHVWVTAQGVTPEGQTFQGTGHKSFPLLARRVSLADTEPLRAEAIDPLRLRLNLRVLLHAPLAAVQTHAQVWGTAQDGTPVPVAWIGGIVYPEETGTGTVLPLTLDSRWIARAQAQAPFELRALRLVDPETYVSVIRVKRLPFTVDRLPAAAPNPGTEITEEMRSGSRPPGCPPDQPPSSRWPSGSLSPRK